MLVPFESVPVPTLLSRDDVIVAVNPAYEAFMGVRAADVVGRTVADLIQQFVTAPDQALVDGAADARRAGRADDGHLWCRVVDGAGHTRSIRVVWEPGHDGIHAIYLLDAESDAALRSMSEMLARAAGELVHCRDEAEVLARAVDALFARDLTATVLLIRPGEERLAYGPTRSTARPRLDGHYRTWIEPHPPPRRVLEQLNPRFAERRAVFLQDATQAVASAYAPGVAEQVAALLPGQRAVQAPLFVDGEAYGALVVTSDALTPSSAGALEMFAELVARAIENVRLHERAAARLAELQRLQGELVERERLAALGEAAAVMAHEVRNPIAALLNAAALLRRGPSPEDLGSLLGVVTEEARRLERLVTDLLDLGRPLTPRLGPIPLVSIVDASVRVLEGRAECGAVTIAVERGYAQAVVDPDLLQLALLNIVRNAAQASPAGGRITIAVREAGDEATIVVDDAGAGFSDDVRTRALEPFFTTRATGTGIGLAVVRRVAEACAGRVEIGQSPDGGGRVVLAFPITRGE